MVVWPGRGGGGATGQGLAVWSREGGGGGVVSGRGGDGGVDTRLGV